jgi:predicted MFS family arabinose efflux permease
VRLSLGAQLALAAPWFAYNLQWGALLPVVLPAQVQALAPHDKELVLGIVMDLGALIALVATPLAGALSDRARDRRPFVAGGGIATVCALLLLAALGPRGSLLAFAAAVLALQLTTNVWGGPYAATIPDRVPPEARGAASGWMMVMTVLGTVAGAVVCGPFAQRGDFRDAYLFIAAALAATLLLTFATVYARGDAHAAARAPSAPRPFFPALRDHRAFYVVLATRALVTMGIYSVYEFFQYFLGDVVHVPNPATNGGLLLGAAALAGVPAALYAGRVGDRIGPLRVVVVTSALMALAAAAFVAIVYHPSWYATIALALAYGAANCAYQAVDWALAIAVLPDLADAGKDMGIWHTSFVFPQMIAPGLTGLVIAASKPVSPQLGYALAFAFAALWFGLGTVFVARLYAATGRQVGHGTSP